MVLHLSFISNTQGKGSGYSHQTRVKEPTYFSTHAYIEHTKRNSLFLPTRTLNYPRHRAPLRNPSLYLPLLSETPRRHHRSPTTH
ncbi:hypothetical protein L2E82_40834 [Cichorium intybus]|uniref:Uncharacterized protein n=1 Tax=Cichorium intybus TaxID=13427 RepID=A0ACB9AMR4_CICIN|nr:hypothetical protein L2E82_40834 [Cichorium intybus]